MKAPAITTEPRPPWKRGDRVQVEGLGAATVLSVKAGERAWHVEVMLDDRSGWSVEARCVWGGGD